MRAAVFTAVNEPLSVEEVTALDPGETDVVVKVGASGVCHSDLSISRGYTGGAGPMVLGHEGAGIVESVGSAVTRVKVGDTDHRQFRSHHAVLASSACVTRPTCAMDRSGS